MKNSSKSFCIIGLGKFGTSLAENLATQGARIAVIDSHTELVNSFSDITDTAIIGDPTNEDVLRAAGVSEYTYVVNCIADLDESLLVTLNLKELCHGKVIARAASEQHKKILEKLGADLIVFPEQDMGVRLSQRLIRSNVLDYLEFAEGYSIVKIKVPEKWVGKSIVDLDVRNQYGITVLAVGRGNEPLDVSPDAHAPFSAVDTVTVLGSEEIVDRFISHVS